MGGVVVVLMVVGVLVGSPDTTSCSLPLLLGREKEPDWRAGG